MSKISSACTLPPICGACQPARAALRKAADHTGRIACGQHTGRNVVCDDAACRHHRSASYRNTRAHHYTAAQPHVVADQNRLGKFKAGAALRSLQRMHCRLDVYTRAGQKIGPDTNRHHVQQDAIDVEVSIAAQVNVVAVVAKERRRHVGIGLGTEELREQ